jgi:hypothetical protein
VLLEQVVGQLAFVPSQVYAPHEGVPCDPTGLSEQVPTLLLAVHVWQAPEHALLQQTPETQFWLVHWSAVEHAAPSPTLGEQAWLTRLQ